MRCEFRGEKTSADACLQHAGMNMVAKIQLPLAKQKCSTSRRTHLYKMHRLLKTWHGCPHRPESASQCPCMACKRQVINSKTTRGKKSKSLFIAVLAVDILLWTIELFFHFLLLDRPFNSSSAAVNDRTVLCLNQYLVLLLVNDLNWINCSFKLAYQKQ